MALPAPSKAGGMETLTMITLFSSTQLYATAFLRTILPDYPSRSAS